MEQLLFLWTGGGHWGWRGRGRESNFQKNGFRKSTKHSRSMRLSAKINYNEDQNSGLVQYSIGKSTLSVEWSVNQMASECQTMICHSDVIWIPNQFSCIFTFQCVQQYQINAVVVWLMNPWILEPNRTFTCPASRLVVRPLLDWDPGSQCQVSPLHRSPL